MGVGHRGHHLANCCHSSKLENGSPGLAYTFTHRQLNIYPHRHIDTYPHQHADAHANLQPHRHLNSHRYRNSFADQHIHFNSYEHTNAKQNTEPHSNLHWHFHSNQHSHSHLHADVKPDSQRDSDSERYPQRDTNSKRNAYTALTRHKFQLVQSHDHFLDLLAARPSKTSVGAAAHKSAFFHHPDRSGIVRGRPSIQRALRD